MDVTKNNWESKNWGRVLHCFNNPQASVSFLETKEGYQCSRHYHEDRANVFIVISGAITVQHWRGDDPTLVEKTLKEGDSYTVPSQEVHRFQVVESGQVIEVYYPDDGHGGGEVRLDDIVRLSIGGRITDE